MDLNLETKKFTGNFKPEFKSMTENFQYKLPQEKCKQSKGAKICASIRRELECEKCSKFFCKIFANKIWKIKQM